MLVTPLWFTLVFFLPETLRSLVGNGSGYANPTPAQYWKKKRETSRVKLDDIEKVDQNNNGSQMSFDSSITTCYNTTGISKDVPKKANPPKNRFFVLPNPFQSWVYLKEKDVSVILLYNSLQYAGMYCVITSVTDLFSDTYGINEVQIGLCFLSNGVGASLGSYTSGLILDWRFKKVAKSLGIDENNANR